MAVSENNPGGAKIKEPATELRRGYVVSEDADYKLRTIANALRGLAVLTDDNLELQDLPEMPAGYLSAIFQVFADAADNIASSAAFVLDPVRVRPRSLN